MMLEFLSEEEIIIEAEIEKINSAKDEAEQKRDEYNKLQQELNEEKDKHIALKTDISDVTRAIEAVSLHSDVKN